MKFLKYFLVLIILSFGNSSFSQDFIGYEYSVIREKVVNWPFRLTISTVKIYRENSQYLFPSQIPFIHYRNDNHAYFNSDSLDLFKTEILVSPPDECPKAQFSSKIAIDYYKHEWIMFTDSIESLPGYYNSSLFENRGYGIKNVQGNSSNYKFILTVDIPNYWIYSVLKNNSSPEFKKKPSVYFVVNKPYTLDWSATDKDGDSLVYYLTQPLAGPVGLNNVSPIKPNFAPIPYAAGYGLTTNILDGNPDLTINSQTGIMNFTPTKKGKYLVAVRVEEWRKIAGIPTKIGEIRREMQFEMIQVQETPPATVDNKLRKKVIVDTISIEDEYVATYTAIDSQLTDSLFMYVFPNNVPSENLLDTIYFESEWGKIGQLSEGLEAQKLVIPGIGLVQGQFKWKPKCSNLREEPYKFTIVVRDNTCPTPLYDTTFISLYLKKKENNAPMFTNKYLGKEDTVKITTAFNNRIKKYYIKAGDTFQLAADSIIKTYDKDSTQKVRIVMEPDPLNGQDQNGNDFNSKFYFAATNSNVHSTAVFRWETECADNVNKPIKVTFKAIDEDCIKPDTVTFSIEIFISDQPNIKPIYAHNNIDSAYFKEGILDVFTISVYDSISNLEVNKYKNIQLFPDLTDFAAVAAFGGSMPTYTSLQNDDSLKVVFTWKPNCVNIRVKPYKLFLRTADEGCPTISAYDTIYIYANGPYNSPPEFRDKNDLRLKVIDTTIYGGDIFKFNLFAVDTNLRFDSVYISLDQTSEIANPTIVNSIAYVTPAEGKDSAKAELVWNTFCIDNRTTPYIARVLARDNKCVFPEVDTLYFIITVRERPNNLPKFTFSNFSQTVDTVYAGETYFIKLKAIDTNNGETITIDTVNTNIPSNLPKPIINRVIGIGIDTVKSDLTWNIDCSLIRNEPYIINVASWDDACRNPQDSARHEFIIYVKPNPDFSPSFSLLSDTIIELVAGETFSLELNAKSNLPGDSILISSTGDVYSGIPGNIASFEQTQVIGEGYAQFIWKTSCDQIRDSTYSVYFTTSNPACQTKEDAFAIRFKIIPNTDLTSTIPNVFTPNGDNINDTYRIDKHYLVYCDPGFKFTIFNRWGKIVFESNDPNFEWTADGMSAGTYFYSLESRARSQTGTIDIIR